jgi:DNA-binding response OmpR family regulator
MPEATDALSDKEQTHHTIMIVEDDVHIGTFLVEAITQETAYRALLVGNASEALEAVKSLKPHLLVLDYQLPDINGLDLYDQIHVMSELETVPAIMMSARLPRRELERRTIIGIHKPFDLDDFLQMVKKLLDQG